MEERKKDHIELAFQSQILKEDIDRRFYYEPMLNPHPENIPATFLLAGKKQKFPLWVSSMTGGTRLAGKINHNLARVCKEFGLGMGLGSCRVILGDDTYLNDFNMRKVIGDELPFFANLGIAQVEDLTAKGQIEKINVLIRKLSADGLIIHVNPLQEWFQPEGDRLRKSPIETIKHIIDKLDYPLIVKEVGQGMGYYSLKELLQLPLEAIEFAAFGGTNFAKLELMRSTGPVRELFEPLAKVGHDAYEMMEMVNSIVSEGNIKCRSVIVSGGIKNFLDGYYLIRKSKLPAIYGQASGFLKYAKESYEELREYVQYQINGLKLSYTYLKIKDE